MAGNFVQLGVFIGICVFWVSTYVYRVATKVRCDAYNAAAKMQWASDGAHGPARRCATRVCSGAVRLTVRVPPACSAVRVCFCARAANDVCEAA